MLGPLFERGGLRIESNLEVVRSYSQQFVPPFIESLDEVEKNLLLLLVRQTQAGLHSQFACSGQYFQRRAILLSKYSIFPDVIGRFLRAYTKSGPSSDLSGASNRDHL